MSRGRHVVYRLVACVSNRFCEVSVKSYLLNKSPRFCEVSVKKPFWCLFD